MTVSTNNIIKVWDPLIRIFHWSLFFFFSLAFLTEDDWMSIHSYAGYTVALLVIFRLVWGVIGTRHARFLSFVTAPQEVVRYLKQLLCGRAKRHIGHNPAAAAMMLVLLLSLSMTVLSGMSLYATEGYGPLAGTFISSLSDDLLEDVHELFANFTLLMVFCHVGGVLLSSLLHWENLIGSMVTGKKQNLDRTQDEDECFEGKHV